MKKMIDPQKIRAICINCCGLFGDVLIRTPFIEKVAITFPQAKITAIVDVGREDLLNTHPNVTAILSFNRCKKSRWLYVKRLMQLLLTLWRERFDIFFNLYGGGSSAALAGFSKAHYRFGFYYKESHRRYYTHSYPMPQFATHWGQEFSYLLQEFGVKPGDLRAGTTFILTDTAKIKALEILSVTAKPWVLINLGAGDFRKIWAIKNQVALAQWLVETYGYQIGVFINPGQEYLAQEFAQLAAQQGLQQFQLVLAADFAVMGALVAQAKFLISGDTGVMHLAFGVRTPVLILFTYTRPELVIPQDCLVEVCFLENPQEKDAFGRCMGEQNLPLELAREKAKMLITKI